MAMPKGDAAGLDLLSTVAVPIDQPLDEPERIERLVLLLEGTTADALAVRRTGQTALPAGDLRQYRAVPPSDPWCLIELRRVTPPTELGTPPNAAVKRYQRASPFIQSDDPAIRSQARAIIGSQRDPWQQTVALNRWVYTTLTKRLTAGLPSAVDVLASRVGDCHEHTVLFTALARSLDLPTRAVAGLVSYHGKLYYHAWPEVWFGDWVPTDPTLGQLVADATHVGLVEADDESLLGLAQFVGQLRASVLRVQRTDDSH
jgi:transglutaminase-like putative cysteine protease